MCMNLETKGSFSVRLAELLFSFGSAVSLSERGSEALGAVRRRRCSSGARCTSRAASPNHEPLSLSLYLLPHFPLLSLSLSDLGRWVKASFHLLTSDSHHFFSSCWISSLTVSLSLALLMLHPELKCGWQMFCNRLKKKGWLLRGLS